MSLPRLVCRSFFTFLLLVTFLVAFSSPTPASLVASLFTFTDTSFVNAHTHSHSLHQQLLDVEVLLQRLQTMTLEELEDEVQQEEIEEVHDDDVGTNDPIASIDSADADPSNEAADSEAPSSSSSSSLKRLFQRKAKDIGSTAVANERVNAERAARAQGRYSTPLTEQGSTHPHNPPSLDPANPSKRYKASKTELREAAVLGAGKGAIVGAAGLLAGPIGAVGIPIGAAVGAGAQVAHELYKHSKYPDKVAQAKQRAKDRVKRAGSATKEFVKTKIFRRQPKKEPGSN